MNTIYCSATHLKLLAGSSDSRGIKVSKYASIPLPAGGMINGIITDTEVMSKFFLDISNKYGLSRGAAWLVVNNTNINTKILDIPSVDEAKALDFIKREISQPGEDESDNTVFDFTVINPKAASGGVTVLAVGANRDFLEAYKDVMGAAGIDLKGIDLGINCQIRLAAFLPQLKEKSVILVWIDGRALCLTLFSDGEYRVQNRSRMVHPEDDPAYADEIISGISSMIQFSKSQRGSEAVSAAFIAGMPPQNLPAIENRVGSLEIDIKQLELSASVSLAGKEAEQESWNPGEYLLNIGSLIGKK